MKYNDVRDKIKTGDLIAFSHGNIGGRIIQFFTQSHYTHVGVAYCIADRVMIFESVIPHTRLYPLSKLGDFYWIGLNGHFNIVAEEFAFSRLGERYSIIECIRGWLNICKNENAWWQCSEYAKQIYRANGYKLSRKDTPAELINEMLNTGAESIFVEV